MDRPGRTALVALVVVVVVLAAGIMGFVSWYNGTSYVTATDAEVTAPMAPVGSLVAGTLTTWTAHLDEAVSAGQVLGTVLPATETAAVAPSARGHATAPTPVPIVAPFAGTVAETSAVVGETVAPGTPLAYVANLADPSVVAYVKETDIRNVKVGQTADVHVDALPGTTFTGTVEGITLGTASTFSLLPSPPPSGSVTVVTQYVPVNISLPADAGQVLPGESATVRIQIR
jgi:multidrug resistance efflux pump